MFSYYYGSASFGHHWYWESDTFVAGAASYTSHCLLGPKQMASMDKTTEGSGAAALGDSILRRP